ncbi:GPW/gp25 family protein [uncultured Winogradskyella sp.]|uniref:GPW/gp25 family protein n=1 Tax=uncultured Winogradskyella sp. TaxID=395353 RepID=UPI00262854D5|nr:GPW/gp25 family protein [uncultured Winogradskyella sp.]
MNYKEKEFLGSGWSFPVTFSAGNYSLNLTKYEENINESIDIILLTAMGERYMQPEFGSGLHQFFFKKMDETLKGEIKDTVMESLLNNEPRIEVLEVEVSFSDLLNGLIEILITYVFNQTNTRHNYVFPFYINEGTNLKVS